MPIAILCPSCNSRLNAPESAAGKNVKCPKCQTLMQVPQAEAEFEVVEPPAAAAPKSKPAAPASARRPRVDEDDDEEAPPRKKRPRDEDDDDDEEEKPRAKKRVSRDDDDDDEEDDKPRPKKKPKKKAKSEGGIPLPVIIGGGVSVLFLMLIAGVGGYLIFFHNREPVASTTPTQNIPQMPLENPNPAPVANQPRVPVGWVPFTVPGTTLTVNTPTAMEETQVPGFAGNQVRGFRAVYKNKVFIVITETPPQAPPPGDPPDHILDMIARNATTAAGQPQSGTPTTMGNRKARLVQYNSQGLEFMAKIGLVNRKVVGVMVCSANELNPNDPDIVAFLNTMTGG